MPGQANNRLSRSLFYSVAGAGKETVVLLHGLLGSSKNLATVARALEDEFTVISVDLRNHGRSPHHAVMTFPLMAEDIMLLMDGLSINSFCVLGHSLGGKVAMAAALLYPQRVSRLVCADIAPVTYPPQHKEIFLALSALDLEHASSRSQLDLALAKHINDAGLRQFLLQNLDAKKGRYSWRMNLPAIIANYDRLRAGFTREVTHDDSSGVQEMVFTGAAYEEPTLFIGGQKSSYLAKEYEDITRSFFPAFQYRGVAGAGHWLHTEQPDVFNRIVSRFLRG